MRADELHYDAPRLNASCVMLALGLLALYVYFTLEDTERLHLELSRERRQRAAAERRVRAKEDQLDGALEKIHDLNGDEGGNDEPTSE